MPLDPRAQRFLTMLGASGARSMPATATERREAFRTLLTQAGLPPSSAPTREIVLPGAADPLPGRVYEPEPGLEGQRLPGLLFFHGGGFTAGDLDTHHAICGALARASGCRVVAPAYRLAPEHPFPAAVDDAVAVAEALFGSPEAFGLDPERIAVGGDSVGGNLAVTACHHLVERGRRVAALLLICPVLDGRRAGASHRLFAQGYFLDEATMDHDLAAYGGPGGLPIHDPRVSPLLIETLGGLPPTIVETAEYDMVRDDGSAFAARLAAAGVAVRTTCHPGMIHLFYGFGRLIPAGAAALAAIGERLGAILGRTATDGSTPR